MRRFMMTMESPIGRLWLVAQGDELTGLLMDEPGPEMQGLEIGPTPVLEAAREQLAEYFAGERHTFDLPLAFEGSPFQRDVWGALREIPFGETWSYAQLAERIGRPRAVRAVGAANGRNPISIVVPCHRVIGANGSLVGYGGGLARKEWLLAHEGWRRPRPTRAMAGALFA